MPIDNELIEKTIAKLVKKINDLRDEEREIQKLITNLHLIRRDGKTEPKDPLTEEPLSEERIKEIFNSVAKRGAKYLGE